MKSRRSLRRILTLAWVVPSCVALGLSVVAFLTLGWIDYQHALTREVSDLESRSATIARRMAAEVLLGDRGSSSSVADILKADLGVSEILVTKEQKECGTQLLEPKGFCVTRAGSEISLTRMLPLVQDPTYVRVSSRAPTYRESLKLPFLLWSMLPVLFILGAGILVLNRLLKKYVLEPVETLAGSPHSGMAAPESWPSELAQLSVALREAFLRRDLALVGQLAGGVIHDLKTLLHSSWTAAQLAGEQPLGSEKRLIRLESFLKASQINYPKMEALIQTTLDGSREIQVRPLRGDLGVTVSQALRATSDLVSRSRVKVEVETEEGLSAILHDSAQLERVLINIVKNAVEAAGPTADGSRIRIRTMHWDAGGARITIEDSGPGLGESPGEVLQSVRSTKAHGTGLGLVISRKIVEAHSGVLTAGLSTDLGGARFDVLIPGSEATL